MGSAFARGLKDSRPRWTFSTWSPSGVKAKALAQELGAHWIQDLGQVPRDITGIVLGFKPQLLAAAAPELLRRMRGNETIISLLAAVELAELQTHFPASPILRLMPSLAVGKRQGVVLWQQAEMERNEQDRWALALADLGQAFKVTEALMDVYTMHAACAPAFVYQWLLDAGRFAKDHGGDPQAAVKMMGQALRGALSEELDFSTLDAQIKRVASKGGVTQAVLDHWKSEAPDYVPDGFEAGLQRLRAMKKS